MLRNEGARAISVRHVLNQKKPPKFSLVPFLTSMEVVAPLENDPILSGRSIQPFRHLELQNPSIISDCRHRSRMVKQFQRRKSRRRRNGGGGGGMEEEYS